MSPLLKKKNSKPLNPKVLRPFFLTLCVGKLFEHVLHNQLSPHIEDNGYIPDTMYGFLPHLSTQDTTPAQGGSAGQPE